jgi:hypothetical protein
LRASPCTRAAGETAPRRYAERTFDVTRVGERFDSLLSDINNAQQ